MRFAPRASEPAIMADDRSNALQVRAFAWYLVAVIVGASLLWVVVPRLTPTESVVSNVLLPAVLAFDALSLLVLWRFPRSLRELRVAQFASYFPILLGYLAVAITEAVDPGARQVAIAAFAVWVPVVVVFAFYAFGSRYGLVAALAFVGTAASVVVVAVAQGATLDGPAIAYVAVLFVASVALAVLVYGTSQHGERSVSAWLATAVAAEVALRDVLTGVHSRYALEERFDQELVRARREGRPLAVYFLDLDDFKRVNDAHGHATGDALLRAFAGRVQDTVRGSDTVGRLGGDEFVVLASVAGDEEAHALAERLVAACAEPVELDGTDFGLSLSVGVAVHPADGLDRAALLRAADAAMYVAKGSRGRRWSAHVRRGVAGSGDPEGGGGGAPADGGR